MVQAGLGDVIHDFLINEFLNVFQIKVDIGVINVLVVVFACARGPNEY